ncbi:hypothetical protein J5N97_005030 [Dioscorea zingiberensis]|uniref:DNA polymerase n=1 Tax=Dioscorea zingiberensis TaxID=325984 RepID=A0A9D5HS07_9LILI|nr:hypothetical protein J5N97_005030 [Dioscorea zingiberensis]
MCHGRLGRIGINRAATHPNHGIVVELIDKLLEAATLAYVILIYGNAFAKSWRRGSARREHFVSHKSVMIICGGSFRRGKASCGDLDIIITHPDGESHKGVLPKYVQHLKNTNFLREDLVFSTHSTEGTDSGVDTYFGLCTYPGQEQRYRIDLKVYPRSIYAFGLIAWTGNDVLNRRLRLLAESKGYRLDDTGLYLAAQSSGPEIDH